MTKKQTSKLKYERTPKGLLGKIYGHQKSHSIARHHKPPTYHRFELIEWATEQSVFWKLYSAWEASGYVGGLRPSVDRLDDSKGYSFDNIQLITHAENARKGSFSVIDRKGGSGPISKAFKDECRRAMYEDLKSRKKNFENP